MRNCDPPENRAEDGGCAWNLLILWNTGEDAVSRHGEWSCHFGEPRLIYCSRRRIALRATASLCLSFRTAHRLHIRLEVGYRRGAIDAVIEIDDVSPSAAGRHAGTRRRLHLLRCART